MTAKIGTTKATFDSKVPLLGGITYKVAKEAFENLGKTYVGLVELQAVERTEPLDFDTDSKVKLRVTSIEVALDDEHAEELRQQLADVYASRTGNDTLFDGDGPSDGEDGFNVLRDGAGVLVQGHTYIDTADAVCRTCGKPAGNDIHNPATTDQE